MATNLIVNGITYRYPQTGDSNWGAQSTAWATAITNSTLQKSGGAFTLTAPVDFGPTSGIKTSQIKSQSPTANTGFLALGEGETITWTGLSPNSLTVTGNTLQFNGTTISSATGINSSNVIFTPTGTISATNVQSAIAEVDSEKVSKLGDTMTGDLTFSGSSRRILGDFSNATIANRTMFQTSTVNAATGVAVIPNGTARAAIIEVDNDSVPLNTGYGRMQIGASELAFISGIHGTGTYLPMAFYTGGSERLRIATSGAVAINKQVESGAGMLQVMGMVSSLASSPTTSSQLLAGAHDFISGPSYSAATLQYNGKTTAGSLVYLPTVPAANSASIEAINCSALTMQTNTGPIVFGTNSVERMRIAADGLTTMRSATDGNKLLVGGLTCAARISTTATGTLIEGTDYTGGASYQPIYVGGSLVSLTTSGVERMRIAADGIVTIANAVDSGGIFFGNGDTDVGIRRLSNKTLSLRASGGYLVTLDTTSGFVVTNGTIGLGYGTGAGGTVTQATSKSTAVTLNKPTGKIYTHAESMAAGAKTTFLLNNSLATINDAVVVNIGGGVPAASSYRCWVGYTNTSQIYIGLENMFAGALAQVVEINFTIIKGAVS